MNGADCTCQAAGSPGGHEPQCGHPEPDDRDDWLDHVVAAGPPSREDPAE